MGQLTLAQKAKIFELKFAGLKVPAIRRRLKELWPDELENLSAPTVVRRWYNRSDEFLETGEISRKVNISFFTQFFMFWIRQTTQKNS